MLVAREKRKKNIAEYVLYMWQIEDTIRALNFDMNLLEERVISQFKQKDAVNDEIRDWYANIMLAMHEEGLKHTGHLKLVQGVVDELFELHKRLLFAQNHSTYHITYSLAKQNISLFREKLNKPDANEIEVCFYGLYGLLLLRLKKKEITPETQKAMQTFSDLLAQLSIQFHQVEQGKAEF